MAVRFLHSCTFFLAASVLLQPLQTLAQAGSRPPQYFDTPQMFYHSLNGSAPSQAGIANSQPLAPNGVWQLGPDTHYLLWVELAQGRLNVLENLGEAGIVIRKRIPVSIGKQGIGKQSEGDNKTPIGIYRIESRERLVQNDQLRLSHYGRNELDLLRHSF